MQFEAKYFIFFSFTSQNFSHQMESVFAGSVLLLNLVAFLFV